MILGVPQVHFLKKSTNGQNCGLFEQQLRIKNFINRSNRSWQVLQRAIAVAPRGKRAMELLEIRVGIFVFFCWDRGWRWIKNQGTPRFVNDCTFHINFIWLLLHVSYIYSIGSLSRLLFCLYHSLPYRYWATHSADEVGTQTISPFYWALESGSFHSAKVGCGKELKLGFTRNVGIPQIHPNPTCGRCWYCDTSFTAKQKASNVVCVSVIASLSPFVLLSRQAMIIDLLSIRADRDNYYYGCDPSSFEELLS